METQKCTSCGEAVLSSEKFCKHCGKPIEQKNENDVIVEKPSKKLVLTFEALELSTFEFLDQHQGIHKLIFSIELDGDFIGEIKTGEKIDTFVARGKHEVILKRNKGFTKTKFEILVEDNQIILLSINRMSMRVEYSIANSDTQKEEREKMQEKDKEGAKKTLWIFIPLFIIVLINVLRLIFN